MEIKFFSENVVLDLTSQNISVQETNSKLADKLFSKFTFPFEIVLDGEFLRYFGDYISFDSRDLAKEIKGILFFEGKSHEAKLEILSIEGNILTGQIDFGFEDIPNYDKMLSELPLHQFEVEDIHTYAAEICQKQYPETDFNFPRIHTKKYDPSNKVWDAFEGYYNHTIIENGELKFARNVPPSRENNWNVDNVNIIHPCPHILYLLKAGFKDVGFDLEGDILTDELLSHRWVFSGTEYFSREYLGKETYEIYQKDAVKSDTFSTFYDDYFYKKIVLKEVDGYRLDFHFNLEENTQLAYAIIIHNNARIPLADTKMKGQFTLSTIIETTSENTEIIVDFLITGRGKRPSGPNGNNNGTGSGTGGGTRGGGSGQGGGTRGEGLGSKVLELVIKSKKSKDTTTDKDDDEIKVIDNKNHIDLTRAVPNMTFGEFLGVVKNWFNYDFTIVDQKVIMNKIVGQIPDEPKDFRNYEIPHPKRTFLSNKVFYLKFQDLDNGEKLDAVLYDSKGLKINGTPPKENVNTIEINGYPMPVAKYKEHHTPTAWVKRDTDNTLALVYYDGLVDGINNAQNPVGVAFPEVFHSHWETWLKQRIVSEEYQWKFYANAELFSGYSVKDYIYCYHNHHIIKNINKDKVGDNTYEIEITTETIL